MDIHLENWIRDIPPLKKAVVQALEILSDDDVNYMRLESVINGDPALLVLVLKLANTPFYGMQKEVSSIREASIILGVHTLRNIIITAGVVARFPVHDDGCLDRDGLWAHMRAVAICAQIFAKRVRVDPQKAFTAGLLHDVGKLALDFHCSDAFREIVKTRDQFNCSLKEAEEKVIGINHADVGGAIASNWRLPDDVVSAIRDHHDVERGGVEMLTCIVQAADMTARALKMGNGGDEFIPPLEKVVTEKIGWDTLNVKEIAEDILDLYEKFTNVFQG